MTIGRRSAGILASLFAGVSIFTAMHGVAIAAEKSYELNVKFSGEELVVSKLQSCIFRKLRSLGDVVVTTQKSDNTDYNVEIMVLESGFNSPLTKSSLDEVGMV